MANDGIERPTISAGAAVEKFGCASGANGGCEKFESCALMKALAEGFNVESGIDTGDKQLGVSEEHNHNGKMG